MGKKDHVIHDLVQQCEQYERYLHDQGGKSIDQASSEKLNTFVQKLEEQGQATKNTLRALALYYKFKGNKELSSQANALRETRIAAVRPGFNLRDFRGLDPEHVSRLESLGIRNTEQMLAAGQTLAEREALARQADLPYQVILEFVKLSDLARIEGVKAIRARLYYDAGLDTVEKLANSDPEQLRPALEQFVRRTNFAGIAPQPKELRFTVQRAQQLDKIVKYD